MTRVTRHVISTLVSPSRDDNAQSSPEYEYNACTHYMHKHIGAYVYTTCTHTHTAVPVHSTQDDMISLKFRKNYDTKVAKLFRFHDP